MSTGKTNDFVNINKETDNIIIPHRFIPFDLGLKIDPVCQNRIYDYFLSHSFRVMEISSLLRRVSMDVLFRVEISVSLYLYIYSYGIGVFRLEDDLHTMSDKYAIDYCEYRKKAHKELLEFKRGEISTIIKEIIGDLRTIARGKHRRVRPSASEEWEYNGLSYVMTVSYIIKKEKERNDYSKFNELDKKNLHIMLQPSIANKEDTMVSVGSEEDISGFDPYNFELDSVEEPHNWIRSEECAIYISWAAVVVYLRDFLGKYMEIIECLEVDLQAMWLYTYCQYLNLKSWSSEKKLTSAQLKKEKYDFQRRYNEFISENDSSVPVYLLEIRRELIRTSAIDNEKEEFLEYIDYCIDETESYESERQRKYSAMNEVLLFIIAFIQIAPMLYNAMLGNYNDIKVWPVIAMMLMVGVAIFFIVKKD